MLKQISNQIKPLSCNSIAQAAIPHGAAFDTPPPRLHHGGAASLEAVGFDRLNDKAGQPLHSGFFTSERLARRYVLPVHATVAPSMVGRSGEAFGLAGFFVASLSTLLRSRPLHLTVKGGDSNPDKGAYPMPKSARIFLQYSLVAIITLAIERHTPITVILLALAAFCLVPVIGGRSHD